MTTLIWPTQLPSCFQRSGFQYKPLNATIRTQLDAGIDKVRNRYTSEIWELLANIIVTLPEKSILDQFYNQTLFNGSLPFIKEDPLNSEASYNWRFLTPPTYVPFGWDTYTVSIHLERIPATAIYPTPTVVVPVYFTGEIGSTTTTITAVASFATWYQWQKDGVDIPGAVSATYTLPTIELLDHRAIYTCTVSNPAHVVVSSDITFLTSSPIMTVGGYDPDTYEMLFQSRSYYQDSEASPVAPSITHASEIEAFDFEGVSRTFNANEAVFESGRGVDNIYPDSEDASGWTATGTNPPQITDEGNGRVQIDFNTVGFGWGGQSARSVAHALAVVGHPTVGRARVKFSRKLTGSELIYFNWAVNSHAPLISISADDVHITSGEWVEITDDRDTVTTVATSSFGVYPINVALSTPLTVWVEAIQLEDVTGQSDIVTPSEYIPTNGSAAKKVFGCANGTSVLNNVVTDAVGTKFTTMPQLKYQPEAVNLALDSFLDNGTSSWAKAAALTATDAGVSTVCPKQNAWRHDNSGASSSGRNTSYPTSPTAIDEHYSCVFIMEKGDSPDFVMGIYNSTDITFLVRIRYTWATSAVSVVNDNTASLEYDVVELKTDIVKVTLSTKTITTDIGDNLKAYLYPTGTSSTAYYATVHYGALFEASLGEVRNLGVIYTDGATATANRTDYQLGYYEGRQDQGMWHVDLDLERGDVQADVSGSNVLRLSSGYSVSGILYWHSGAANIVTYDDTTTSTLSISLTGQMDVMSIFDSAYDSGLGILQAGGDGAYDGTPAQYDGAFSTIDTHTYRICAVNPYPQRISELSYYDLPYLDAKAKADSIMGV